MRLSQPFNFLLGAFFFVDQSIAGSFIMNIYVVPPPEQPEIDVRIDFFDADDDASLGGDTEHVDGSTSIKVSVAPNSTTKRVRVKFEPLNVQNYKVKPAERIVELRPLMQAKTVTWLASVAQDKAYLDNVTGAGSSLKKKDVDKAINRAAYAGAVANTANQRLEAARLEVNGYLVKGDVDTALAVFDKVVGEGFEKADPSKKKVFVGEWFDVLDEAAHKEATPDKESGLIFSSLPDDSIIREEFDKFIDVLTQVVPTVKDKISGVPASKMSEREKLVRTEISAINSELRRRAR
jgi:hypothetical protein